MVKVKNVVFLGFILFLLYACKTYDRYSTKSHYEVNGVSLYTSLSGMSSEMESKLRGKNIKQSILVNGGSFEIKGTQSFDKDKLRNYIIKLLPSRSAEALVVLDFEGQNMIDFRKGTEEQKKIILKYYISIYDTVKEIRPKCTIGFYGYPWRDYWNRDEKWKKDNEALLPLLKHVDAIFPSIYDFYVDNVDVKRKNDLLYVEANIKETLRIAKLAGNKPVFPFVWHRYHSSNKKKRHQFIDKSEFYWHVKQAVETQYESQGIDGIIWWSSERYFYNVSPRGKANKYAQEDFERFSNESSFDYISIIENAINDGTQKRDK